MVKAIEAHYKQLRVKNPAGISWDSIIFNCDTQVRLDCDEDHHTPITSFVSDEELDTFLREDFPAHRFLRDTYEMVRAENQKDLEWSLSTPFPVQCAKAYGCLMRSGYPLPGVFGADRTVFPWQAHPDGTASYITIFTGLGPCCITLSHFEVPAKVWELHPRADPAEEDEDEWRARVSHSRHMIAAVDADSAERRRLDYMFPKPFAYVDKKMQVTLL